MRHTLLLCLFALFVLIMGCGQANEQRAASADATAEYESGGLARPDSISIDPRQSLSSSTARAISDTSRRFIHTADLRFRTKDLLRSTFAIEELISHFDGYVASTQLNSRIDHRYTTLISADSLLETTKYTVTNRLTIRVPSARLDTTLKSLIRHVDFLDHRTITATDVRLMLLGNQLTTARVAKQSARVEDAIDEQGRKLQQTVRAEEKLIDRAEQADKARINNLELEDRIAFSTITLDLYQRQDIRREVLANEQNIERYEPGFLSRMAEALEDGWDLLLDFFVFLGRSWSVVLLGILGFVLLRRLWSRT